MDDLQDSYESSFRDGVVDLIAGSMGGIATVYVGQPLDTVKVKMQTFPHLYRGMLDCFVKTYRYEGFVKGLYAGTTPAIVANVAENSVLFACYGACQKLVASLTNAGSVEEMGALANATAGSAASFFSSFTLCPTELIKVKLQCAREVAASNDRIHLSAYSITQSIMRKEGVFGLFRGLQSTIFREMPGYFVFFGTYEGVRGLLTPAGKKKSECGALSTIIAGAVSGIALWLVIYPIDAIKSRIQASTNAVDEQLWNYVIKVAKKEGVLSLYSGLRPTLIRTIPATAALFLSYEWTKLLLADIL